MSSHSLFAPQPPRRAASGSARANGDIDRRRALGLFAAGAVTSVVAACSEPSSESSPEPSSGTSAPSSESPSPPESQQSPDAGDEPSDSVPSRDQMIEAYQDASPGEFGLEVPGTQLFLPESCAAAALTLDACGGPEGSAVDEALLQTLRALEVPATLFINRRWAQENPGTMEELVSEPLFDIENHGTKHLPLSATGRSAYGIAGTGSVGEIYDEIMGNQEFLRTEYGVDCRYFRSGTAFLDEVSVKICSDLGLTPVNFTINLDDGATLPSEQVAARAAEFSPRDIALGHFNNPASGTGPGIAEAMPGLLAADLRFVALREAC